MKITNIKIKDFIIKKDVYFYSLVQKEVKEDNLFNGKICNWGELTYDEVAVIEKIYKNEEMTIEQLTILFKICYKEDDFLNCWVIDFFKAKKWIDKKIIETVKRERAMLASQMDSRMIAAGSGNLAKFGTLNAKIRLGEMFGFRPSEVGAWKYTEVLFILAHNTTTDLIKNNLATQK